jgi:hypothetical protein
MSRQCGGCRLCCSLVPVASLDKGAGERCKHQSHARGCKVYHKPGMPSECMLWNCRWLVEDDTADLSRPDRSHYVIDVAPDFATMLNNETGSQEHFEVVQIWVDPKHPDAHRDPALRRYLERRAAENVVGLVRWDNERGMAIFPPAVSTDGQWHEVISNLSGPQHSPADVVKALGGDFVVTRIER